MVHLNVMKPIHLHNPFELFVSDMEHWNERPLIYQFFEIVLIIEGSGKRIVNRNRFPYRKGSIFLFTPMDCRGFESTAPTRFCSIRFSEVFIEKNKSTEERKRIVQRLKNLERIFAHHNRFEELIIKESNDGERVSTLINIMVDEYKDKRSYLDENLQHIVSLILNIISRNIIPETGMNNITFDEPLINKLLVHLHHNIQNPKRLRIKFLAEQFNMSESYIGEYFKKLTGESLRCYISTYKMNLVKQRLAYSEYSVAQIADELGFADESHLSRQFKKREGTTPSRYRNRNRVREV